jgi:hypothetical protein
LFVDQLEDGNIALRELQRLLVLLLLRGLALLRISVSIDWILLQLQTSGSAPAPERSETAFGLQPNPPFAGFYSRVPVPQWREERSSLHYRFLPSLSEPCKRLGKVLKLIEEITRFPERFASTLLPELSPAVESQDSGRLHVQT